MRKSAARKSSPNAARIRIGCLMIAVHEGIMSRLMQGSHDRWDDSLDEIIDRVWMEATTAGITPHVCPDRYCDCHALLREHQPPQLPTGD